MALFALVVSASGQTVVGLRLAPDLVAPVVDEVTLGEVEGLTNIRSLMTDAGTASDWQQATYTGKFVGFVDARYVRGGQIQTGTPIHFTSHERSRVMTTYSSGDAVSILGRGSWIPVEFQKPLRVYFTQNRTAKTVILPESAQATLSAPSPRASTPAPAPAPIVRTPANPPAPQPAPRSYAQGPTPQPRDASELPAVGDPSAMPPIDVPPRPAPQTETGPDTASGASTRTGQLPQVTALTVEPSGSVPVSANAIPEGQLQRSFTGRLDGAKRMFNPNPDYPIAIFDEKGKRISYVDTKELIATAGISDYFGKTVTITGTASEMGTRTMVIHARSIRLHQR